MRNTGGEPDEQSNGDHEWPPALEEIHKRDSGTLRISLDVISRVVRRHGEGHRHVGRDENREFDKREA